MLNIPFEICAQADYSQIPLNRKVRERRQRNTNKVQVMLQDHFWLQLERNSGGVSGAGDLTLDYYVLAYDEQTTVDRAIDLYLVAQDEYIPIEGAIDRHLWALGKDIIVDHFAFSQGAI